MTIRLLYAASLGALLATGAAQAQQPLGSPPASATAIPSNSGPTNPVPLRLGSSDTRAMQNALQRAGFDPGPADGVMGQRTRGAVMAWQRQNNMEATGTPSASMMASLGVAVTGRDAPYSAAQNRRRAITAAATPAPSAGMVDAAGHPMGGASAGGGEGPGSNNLRPATATQLQGGRAPARDAAGRPLISNSAGGGEGAGSNNERVGGGTQLQGTAGAPMRDAAGQPLISNSAGGGEGPGSNNARTSAQTPR